MRIAILGATSQVAKDLILSFSRRSTHDLVLFARRPEVVAQWLSNAGLAEKYRAAKLDEFHPNESFDAILNFIGSGDPAQTAALGAAIFDITHKFDQIILDYLQQHSGCKYIFMSSGAAYCSSFAQPVDEHSCANVPLNDFKAHDWYAVAKLYAEARHRARPDLPIIDIRIFNYFSHTLDLSTRFFIADILRSIRSGKTLQVSAENIVRDYIGPDDFYLLVSSILAAQLSNNVVDCYTKAPVDKMTLLSQISERFGLSYQVSTQTALVNATGAKLNYFSLNRRAKIFGYAPLNNSLDTVLLESHLALT